MREDLKNNVVTKANELARASHNLSLIEQKALEYCISTIFKDQLVTSSDIFEVDVEHLGTVFGIDRSQAYREIRKLFTGLLTKVVHLPVVDRVKAFQWLSVVDYNDKEDGLYIQFNPYVCTLLSPAKLKGNFTAYPLEHIINFKHRFSLPLYNICKSNNYRGEGFRTVLSIVDLRKLLSLEENELVLWGTLKKQILKNLNEIETETKMKIVLLERKKGKQVVEVVFKIENENGLA